MSKSIDYSKFDHIYDSDDEGNNSIQKEIATENTSVSSDLNNPPLPAVKTKKGKEGRYVFEHNGRTIYEWEQNLTEVIIYIQLPEGVSKKMLDINISNKKLKVGIKGTNPYLDEETGGPVKPDESMWMISDGELVVNLQKMYKAESWECALRGQVIDAYTKEEVRKQMMLERFQEEHPGFDFSGAEFNGQVPDPREFMGGVKYS